MNELSLRPRSATELVDAALQVFRREPVQFILAAAILYVPWMLVRYLATVATGNRQPSLGATMADGLITAAVYAISSGLVICLAREVYLGGRPDLRAAGRLVAQRALPLVIVALVVLVAVGIGMLLLIVPGVLLAVRFFAARPVVVLERAGVGQALSRSAVLSKGATGHILGTLLLSALIVVVVAVGAGFLGAVTGSRMMAMLISLVVAVVVYPFIAIVETLLYFDMRIRKEGFDIEYLATTGLPPGQTAGAAS